MSIGERDLDDIRIRFKILKTLFDYNNAHPFVSLEKTELLQELKLQETELENNIRFLQDKMLVETVWFMGGEFWTKISSEGINEVHEAETNPDRSTTFFPPVRLIADH